MAKVTEHPEEGIWIHHDAGGIAAAVDAGLARARSSDWTSGTSGDRERALRGLCIETARLMGDLAGKRSVVTKLERDGTSTPAVLIHPAPFSDAAPERLHAARVLYRTIDLLAEENRRGLGFTTLDAGNDAGGWPIVAIVAVVSVAQAAAIGYVAFQAAQVVDRQLQRRADLRMLLAEHAKELELVAAHVEREKKEGKRLPLDEATKAALGATQKRQDELAKKQQDPLSTGLPNIPAAAGGFGLGVVLALGAVAWFAFT